jgi:hypothetical protein
MCRAVTKPATGTPAIGIERAIDAMQAGEF